MDEARSAQRVLLVEDEDDLRETLLEALSVAGYQVIAAEHGLEALEWLDHLRVDLIVTDLLMPAMGGHELVARVRLTRQWGETPILLLSGYANLEPYRDLPVDAVQLKPFALPDFLDRVHQLIGPPV